jgi:hypothetical protein
MAGNGINWELRFGKPANEMDEGEWRMAQVTIFNELCKNQKVNSEDHKRFDRAFWLCVLGIPGAFTAIIIIGTAVINHIGK